MADLEIGSLGTSGINLDLSPKDLPPQVFNLSKNMDFKGTAIGPMVNTVSRASRPAGLTVVHYMHSFYIAGDVLVWLVCGETSAHLLYMGVWYDVTPANMLPSKKYQSTYINGFVLINNGRQKPFYVDIFDPLVPMKTYDVWPDGQLCEVIASLEGILIGFGPVDSSGIFNKSLMIWSDIADPGFLPTNFDYANPASRAGFTTFEGDEFPIAAVPLENRLQLYRSRSIYDISFIGGNNVFSTIRRQLQPNLFSSRAVCAFRRADSGSHFGIGDGYFFLFNGLDIVPLGIDFVTRTFFSTVNRAYSHMVQVVHDNKLDEIWVCYPEVGFTTCNKALIYDLNRKLWKLRDLDSLTAVSSGFFPTTSDLVSWNNLLVTWAQWTVPWKITYSVSEISTLVFAENVGLTKIPDVGAPMSAMAQRLFCAFDSQDTTGRPNNRRNSVKFLTELFPEANGRLRFRIGTSMTNTGFIDWTQWMEFDSFSDDKLDLANSGAYISYEVDNNLQSGLEQFELTGFSLLVKNGGRY